MTHDIEDCLSVVIQGLKKSELPAEHVIVWSTAMLKADRDFNDKMGKNAADRGNAVFLATRTLIWASLVGAALLCLAAGWSIVAGVSRPIGRMTDEPDPDRPDSACSSSAHRTGGLFQPITRLPRQGPGGGCASGR